MNQDLEHLNLLSIFHYVVGGLTAVFACIPFIHFTIGLLMASGRLEGREPALHVIGVALMTIAALFILSGWGLAVAMVGAGRALAKRRHYTFCLVVAAAECLLMPFGTILGVFTIVVLMRESVKRLFENQSPSPAVAVPAGD
jgi:hypothetical protein